jgi:hypothetical protein
VRAIFRDAAGAVIGERSRIVFVNNAATWHRGTLSANETWAAGTVHIVDFDVVVPSGVTLTIEPGAVVKFMPSRQIVVMDGGTLNAAGATEATADRPDRHCGRYRGRRHEFRWRDHKAAAWRLGRRESSGHRQLSPEHARRLALQLCVS